MADKLQSLDGVVLVHFADSREDKRFYSADAIHLNRQVKPIFIIDFQYSERFSSQVLTNVGYWRGTLIDGLSEKGKTASGGC